jgi:2-methylcitrate dehydratase PrpD
LRNTYKPYPCGIVLHAVIDACLELRRDTGFNPAAVTKIIVRGHPLLAQRTNRPTVTTGREAQVSAQHSVAVSLLTGAAGLAQYSDAAVADAKVLELRRKVSMEDDPSMTIQAAEVVIELTGGAVLARRIENARGGEARPLSDADLEEKLRDLAIFGGSDCEAQPLIDAVWSLDTNATAGHIMTLAVPR